MRATIAAAVLAALLVARPAAAAFHFAVIDEVMSGAGGNAGVQYVEVRMLIPGQEFVTHARVTAFHCDATPPTVLLTYPSNVTHNGMDVRYVTATAAFALAAGVAPDYGTLTAGIPVACGMVCFGAPPMGGFPPTDPTTWDATNPNNYVDCVAYGGYNGTKPAGVSAVSPLPPGDGTHSLTRVGSSGNQAADFALACPSPTVSGGTTGGFGPCTPPTTTTTVAGGSTTSTTVAPGGATTTPLPTLSGGPPAKTDCYGEWRVLGATGPQPVVRCRDADPLCDTGNGPATCFFRAQLCFGDAANALYAGKCTAAPVTSFMLPGKAKGTVEAANRNFVLAAVAALGGSRSGEGVSFAQPLTGLRCTDPFNVSVALKTRRGKLVKAMTKLRSVTVAGKRDADSLKLICTP